jgi:hypothetical protein
MDDVALQPVPPWTLVTSHGLVLLYVAGRSDATILEIAQSLGFSERRIADVIRDLVKAGLVLVRREGRRNHYTISPSAHLRHPFIADVRLCAFVELLAGLAPERQLSEMLL